jgi:hypothetical protein
MTKKNKPTSGQSGASLELELSDLNPKERRLLLVLNGEGSGKRVEIGIPELADACWKHKTKFQSNSWTRNSLRRLIRAKLIDKQKRGVFRISELARKMFAKADEEQKSSAVAA